MLSEEAVSINDVLIPNSMTLEQDEIERLLLELFEADKEASMVFFVFMLRKAGFVQGDRQ